MSVEPARLVEVLRARARDRESAGRPSPVDRALLAEAAEAIAVLTGMAGLEGGRERTRRLATVAEAAERLGYSERHIRRLAASDRLTARRVGHEWLIEIEEDPIT